MNKQELEHKLEQAQKDRQGINDNIQWLKEQLAKAEKPKRRHGDFGLGTTADKWPRLTLESFKGEMFSAGKLSCERSGKENQRYPEPIFGNIFDLMKDWGEDFKGWNSKMEASGFEIEGNKIKLYACTGPVCEKEYCSIHLGIDRAEDFWLKFGHALAELKRKQT